MITIAKGESDYLLVQVKDGVKKEIVLEEYELKELRILCEHWENTPPLDSNLEEIKQ